MGDTRQKHDQEVQYLMVTHQADSNQLPAKGDRRWSIGVGILLFLCALALVSVLLMFAGQHPR